VVHLDEQGEAAALQPLDDRALPRRAGEVQRRALQPADQFSQLALAARRPSGVASTQATV